MARCTCTLSDPCRGTCRLNAKAKSLPHMDPLECRVRSHDVCVVETRPDGSKVHHTIQRER